MRQQHSTFCHTIPIGAPAMADINPFTVLHSETIYEGRVFTIIRDEVEHFSGYTGVREVVEHHGGAVIVALFENGDVLLVRQFRYPMQRMIFELPAGKLHPGEDPRHCALRELEEETGWRAGRLDHLTSMLSTPGFCSEVLHIFLATELAPGTQQLEEGEESLEIHRVPLARAINMCQIGEIADGKTIAGLMLASLRAGEGA
jgi:ADP-ribose pyrophosphatase